jgi:hypothetical protein
VRVPALALASLLVATGCGLLSQSSTLVARYDRGIARVTISGQPGTELSGIGPWGASLDSSNLAVLSWQNTQGWTLQLTGPSDGASFWGLLKLEAGRRVAGIDPSHCTVGYADLTPTRTAGTVACHDLIWIDASSVEQNKPIPGEAPFGLAIEFEAMGDGSVPAAPSASP